MILEGIVTTTNTDATINVAPMGPIVDESHFDRFLLRPFQTSTTYRNLKRTGEGVLHITDDVQLFVDAAINDLPTLPRFVPAAQVTGQVIADCCRYFEFQATRIDDRQARTEIDCQTLVAQEVRPFWGFNRAKHAVLEMAILATRVHLLDQQLIVDQLRIHRSAIEKTSGKAEWQAFEKLQEYFRHRGILFDSDDGET